MPIVLFPPCTHQLRQLRLSHGLAIYGLAVRAQVSPTIIGAIERWNYRPGPLVRQRLAAALGVAESEIWPEPQEVAHASQD